MEPSGVSVHCDSGCQHSGSSASNISRTEYGGVSQGSRHMHKHVVGEPRTLDAFPGLRAEATFTETDRGAGVLGDMASVPGP